MKVIIITGQTATGKTKLALELAQDHDGELVNCDSRQIYKGLDIITGKDLPKNSKIWLYDIIDPKEYFSSFEWVQCALKVIKDIFSRGKTPIIVGGTYLYIKHLLYGFETENIPPNWKLRKELDHKPISELEAILKTLDLQSFNRLNASDRNNPHRLIRRIEITSTTVKYLTVSKKNNFTFSMMGLRFQSKEKLIQAITKRVKKRIESGAIEEVKNLIKNGYIPSDPGLKTIGYRQLFNYFNKRCTLEEAINEWITKEIQYAKRQYTFMKKDKNIKWQFIF